MSSSTGYWRPVAADEINEPGGSYQANVSTGIIEKRIDGSPLDRPLSVTFFTNFAAQTAVREGLSLRDLLPRLQDTEAPNKGALPWLKLASFGDKRTPKGSFRNDANVLAIDGIEVDYDAGEVTPEDAAWGLELLGVAAVVYTSPSHTAEKPRWRVLCPTSRSLPPSEREGLVARLNRVFNGVLAGESFTLSQAYYYGRVAGGTSHRVFSVDGLAIDEATDIRPLGKSGSKGRVETSIDPDAIAPMPDERDRVPDTELIANILAGDVYHESLRDLAARYAGRGMRAVDIEVTLRGFMQQCREADRDARWRERMAEIPGMAKSAVEKFGAGRQTTEGGDLVLHSTSPQDSAREMIRRAFTTNGERILQHQGGVFHEWRGTHYEEMPKDAPKAAAYRFLGRAQTVDKEHKRAPFNPTRSKVADVLEALAAEAYLGVVRAPAWLDGGGNKPPASEFLACANGLLHIPSRDLLPHTPQFFSPNAIGYDFDPDAPAPREWLGFLRSIWPDDQQSIDALQELVGLLLTPNTSHQKLFLIVGPKRSGKGTIARVLTELLGRPNVCNPTLASLGSNFGIAPLIGKPLAIISDARLGAKSDHSVIAERLLSISGEDGQTVDRKYLTPWSGTLTTRFVILTNELPRLTDASGALASRFIIWRMTHSFYGREDQALTGRLVRELPGILNWALAGLDRLQTRGYLIQPASAKAEIDELETLASPVGAFVKECCEVGPGMTVGVDDLFGSWEWWCMAEKRRAGAKPLFGRDLRSVVPGLEISQSRDEGGRHRVYCGIALTRPPGGFERS